MSCVNTRLTVSKTFTQIFYVVCIQHYTTSTCVSRTKQLSGTEQAYGQELLSTVTYGTANTAISQILLISRAGIFEKKKSSFPYIINNRYEPAQLVLHALSCLISRIYEEIQAWNFYTAQTLSL